MQALPPTRFLALVLAAVASAPAASQADPDASADEVVVAQDGSGDHTTIQAAIGAARAFPYGFAFLGGRVTAALDVEAVYLSRTWRDFAKTVFVQTALHLPVRPEGWHDRGRTETHATVLYSEHATMGRGAERAGRIPWSRTLTGAEAARYTPAAIFASVARPWDPDPDWFLRDMPAP